MASRIGTKYIFTSLKMLSITLVLFVVGEEVDQTPYPGVCPVVETVPNFNVAKYMGKWYEVARYYDKFEVGAICITANYTLATIAGAFRIKHSQLSSPPGRPTSVDGKATPIGNSHSAQFTVTYSSPRNVVDQPYSVLGTDYLNWATVWSCTNSGVLSVRHAWILSRAQNPPDWAVREAFRVVDKYKISRAYFLASDQKNCPKSD